MPTQTATRPLNKGNAAEINFAIIAFLKLPLEERLRLAEAICQTEENSEPYAQAGVEVFRLLTEAEPKVLTAYMNAQLRFTFDFYMAWTADYACKAAVLTRYFRNNLIRQPNAVSIALIDLSKL